MSLRWILPALLLFAGACNRQPEGPQTSASAEQAVPAAPSVQRKPQADIDWSQVRLEAGDAWIDCGAGYLQGDGRPVLSLAYVDLRSTMQDCRATGLMRLRYKGKVTTSFAALVERAGRVAGDLGIGKRILDIDSAGGHVEAAIRAGDAIGENDWAIWVRNDSVCHSACVLLLAAGDMRVIAGPVGIHRMIRVGSSATSRKELGEELRKVSDELRNYLERNGASVEVYDLMTTVPNRTLRILTPEELDRMGLSGANAVEDDLNRIRLARRCGIDFLRRRDAFRVAYDRQCTPLATEQAQDIDQVNHCGLDLRKRFGFPDAACPDESPMAELDGAILIPRYPQDVPAERAPEPAPSASSGAGATKESATPAIRAKPDADAADPVAGGQAQVEDIVE
ncbi:MAG: hypothetical protein EOP93_21375, partial [Lysobacteraceae bacterium]